RSKRDWSSDVCSSDLKSPYSSEFGRPGKGRIEVATRAGSLLRFHKRFEFAIRDASLDAHNHFTLLAPPRRREWLEGELDGPLVRSEERRVGKGCRRVG